MLRPVTRGDLLRRGPFRRLWLGDAVSMFGDWFTYVAVGTLALSEGAGLLAVAVVLVAHTLPKAALAPLAGRLADRHDRRAIVVVVSLLRAVVVLAMLAAAYAGAIAAVQALLFMRMALGAFVDPAAGAALPQLVRKDQLPAANALLGATYSTIFALGVAVGGVVTAWIGPIGALAIDAASFVIAAGILAGLPRLRPGDLHVDDPRAAAPHGATRTVEAADATAARRHDAADTTVDRGALADAWRLAWRDRPILQAALAKLPVALAAGGGWVVLHARADALADAALALGAFHAARALGTGLGPLLWARVPALRGSVAGLHAGVAAAFAGVAAFTLAGAPTSLLLASTLWGLGVGANWVTATARAQTLTPNHLLGRVGAIDLIGHTLGQCVGGLVGALVADRAHTADAAGWLGLGLGLTAWLALQALVGRRPPVLAALLLACAPPTGAPATSPPAPALAPPPAPPLAPPLAAPVRALASRAVHHDDFARARLYTWTTAQGAATLRTGRRLLVADASSGPPTPFNTALVALAARGDPGHEVAALLLERDDLRRRRYAWPAPFATTLGLGPRRYGDVLVEIVLRPGALIGRFTPAAPAPFTFVDLEGRPVALPAVLADPGRIAAIYHVRDAPGDAIKYRELVVCNESQVLQWSLATPELAAVVAAEIEMIAALRRDTFALLPAPAVRSPAAPAWPAARATPTPIDRWHAALAFDVEHYRPSPGNLERILAALRQYDGRGEPVVERPSPTHGQQASQTAR